LLAIVYNKLGRIRLAKQQMKFLSTLPIDDAIDYYYLAMAESELANTEDAIRYLRIALEKDSKFIVRASNETMLEKIREHPSFGIILDQTDA
jgi:hypothetical protein